MQRPAGKVLVAVGTALVVAMVGAAAALVVTRSGSDSGGGGGGDCLPTLAEHLADDTAVIRGSDNGRAQAAGIDLDGPTEDVSSEILDTGFQPDPLTDQTVFQFLEDPGKVGYRMTDVDCWVGGITQAFAARGDFDADALSAGLAGEGDRAVLDGDLLAYSPEDDAQDLIDPSEPPGPALPALLDSLDERGVLTFGGTQTGDDAEGPWTAVGLAEGEGDGFDLVVVWAYADADEIDDDVRGDVVTAVGEGSVGEMIEGDPDDLVEVDGSTLWLRAPLVGQTQSWLQPMRVFDPIFTPGDDSGSDDDDGG